MLKLRTLVYDRPPLKTRDLKFLLFMVRMIIVDRNSVLSILFNDCDDPKEIRIALTERGRYLGLRCPMPESGLPHPLILAAEKLTQEEVEEVIREICGKGTGTREIGVVTEKLKDVTSAVFGEDR